MDYYIRIAKIHDAEGIARLSHSALGYDYAIESTAEKLNAILFNARDQVFVAEINNLVVGYIHASVYDVLYAPTMVNIMGLAVSPDYRHIGIGRSLIESVVQWGKSIGACAIRLNSGAARKEAHSFYRHCGFIGEKEQLRFTKPL